jgi:hypothetical protein
VDIWTPAFALNGADPDVYFDADGEEAVEVLENSKEPI